MSNWKTVIVASALAGMFSAASGVALAQPASAQSAQDARELQAYVLTMDVVKKVAKANKAALAAKAKDPAQQRLAKKKAELAVLEAKEEPTDADQERMYVLADEISRFEDEDEQDEERNDAVSVTALARNLDASPELAAAVRSAGLSTHEYATASVALMQASITHALLKEKMLKQAPPDIPKQHLEFVRSNEKELAALDVFKQVDD